MLGEIQSLAPANQASQTFLASLSPLSSLPNRLRRTAYVSIQSSGSATVSVKRSLSPLAGADGGMKSVPTPRSVVMLSFGAAGFVGDGIGSVLSVRLGIGPSERGSGPAEGAEADPGEAGSGAVVEAGGRSSAGGVALAEADPVGLDTIRLTVAAPPSIANSLSSFVSPIAFPFKIHRCASGAGALDSDADSWALAALMEDVLGTESVKLSGGLADLIVSWIVSAV